MTSSREAARYRQTVLPLLNCLAAARDRIPEALLVSAAGLEEQSANEALLDLSPFLTRSAAGVSLFHKSIADWLGDRQASAGFTAAVQSGHNRLASACWREYDAGAEAMSPYCRAQLPAHCLLAERWTDVTRLINGGTHFSSHRTITTCGTSGNCGGRTGRIAPRNKRFTVS